MSETINEYQRQLALRGLGSVFQPEGPESVGGGISMAGPYGGMSPREATLAGATPSALRELGRQQARARRADQSPAGGVESNLFSEDTLDLIRSFAPAEDAPLGNLTKKKMMEADAAEVAAKLEARPEPLSPLDQIAEQLSNLTPAKPAPAPQTAEEFSAAEEDRAVSEGMPVADPEVVQKALDDSFSTAMSDFIGSVRGAEPDKRERTLDDYKKEFAEATGVDISGKVDKSSALMAMGLALMQNRAGKGFNVGRMLSAVGKAGESALPALEKAKERAKTASLAAGKYALESRSADRAKDEAADLAGKRRGKYWVYKKGGKGTEFSNFDDGEFVDLNPFELNKLIENKDFADQYEFIDASDRMSILEKRAEGVDLGDMWTGYERVSLIGGKADDVPPELQVLAASADPNYKGLTDTNFKLAEKPETIVRRFGELQSSINSGAEKFEELISAIDSGVSIPEQMVSTVFTAMRNLGIDVGDQPTDITKARTMLKQIAVREATNILQESGKTLSDMDRKRVEQLVGEISFASGDAELIKKKLKDIYNLTVLKPQKNLDRAVSWMEDNAGISFGPAQGDMPTEAELNAINESRKARGEQPLTMDDYK